MEKKRRLSSLKKKIIVFVILCWGVPIAVFFAYTTSSYRKGIIEKTEGLMEDQLENMASFASIRIEDAITLCQRPSYEKTWENAWKKYLRGDYSRDVYKSQGMKCIRLQARSRMRRQGIICGASGRDCQRPVTSQFLTVRGTDV